MKFFAGLIAVMVALTVVTSAQGTTLLVSNTNDNGAGSLRQAIINNNTAGGNTIVFSNVVTGAITLTSGELLITTNVTILGPGSGSLAVNGNAASRVFHITNAATAAISGLTITRGFATGVYPTDYAGAGVWNDHSTLTLSNCAIIGNNNSNGPGGGICNDGSYSTATLAVIASTMSGNSAFVGGGAIYNYGYSGTPRLTIVACTISSNTASDTEAAGGGIWNDGNHGGGTLYVSNSTFSGNSVNGNGGSIYNGGNVGEAFTVCAVTATTFASNSATNAGGSAIFNNGVSATLTLGNTILKAGISGGTIVNTSGLFTNDGYNLSSDGANGLLKSSTDQTNVDPLLGPLANNGGPTLTHALLPGSPAIDKGKSFGLTTDQRGLARPFDFASVTNASGGDGSDIGAFELGRPNLGIQQSGTNAVFSWPSYYSTNFALQSSTNLLSSNSWVTVSGSAAVAGSLYQQTNGPISSNRFFRLKGN